MAQLRLVGKEDHIRRLVALLPKARHALNRADPDMCRLHIEIDDRILEEWIHAHEQDPVRKDQLLEMM